MLNIELAIDKLKNSGVLPLFVYETNKTRNPYSPTNTKKKYVVMIARYGKIDTILRVTRYLPSNDLNFSLREKDATKFGELDSQKMRDTLNWYMEKGYDIMNDDYKDIIWFDIKESVDAFFNRSDYDLPVSEGFHPWFLKNLKDEDLYREEAFKYLNNERMLGFAKETNLCEKLKLYTSKKFLGDISLSYQSSYDKDHTIINIHSRDLPGVIEDPVFACNNIINSHFYEGFNIDNGLAHWNANTFLSHIRASFENGTVKI